MIDERRTEVAWNIAADQSRFVGDLLKRAIEFSLKGNLGSWFYHLNAMREICNHDLTPEEEKNLDEFEEKLWKMDARWKAYRELVGTGQKPSAELVGNKKTFSSEIRLYQRKLFKSMKKLGYFPSKDDRTKLHF